MMMITTCDNYLRIRDRDGSVRIKYRRRCVYSVDDGERLSTKEDDDDSANEDEDGRE